ncbi:MAG TPA: DUF192 domain-containing protein [Candidatus Paceibacterota bacterium]|nr:DUF192 domain-containing protein [Candidatus Paceibacterota bacterium]
MRNKLIIAGIACVAIGGCLLLLSKGHESAPSNDYRTAASTTGFQYEVVSDPAAQERGLSGRTDVPENYGMLFVFPTDSSYGFWMKDMLVPIDIVWLSDTGTVLKVDAGVATSTYPNVFYPPSPVRYVLETKAGESQRQRWMVGTTLQIPFTN